MEVFVLPVRGHCDSSGWRKDHIRLLFEECNHGNLVWKITAILCGFKWFQLEHRPNRHNRYADQISIYRHLHRYRVLQIGVGVEKFDLE